MELVSLLDPSVRAMRDHIRLRPHSNQNRFYNRHRTNGYRV